MKCRVIGIDLWVYGTKEEPLFLVNDIICGIIGMNRPSDNQFFRDNRENDGFVKMWRFPTPPSFPELRERFKKSNKDYIYFFTENGIINCLSRSNKPAAKDALKDIRLILDSIRQGERQKTHQAEVNQLKHELQKRDQFIGEL